MAFCQSVNMAYEHTARNLSAFCHFIEFTKLTVEISSSMPISSIHTLAAMASHPAINVMKQFISSSYFSLAYILKCSVSSQFFMRQLIVTQKLSRLVK
jgi:hypothetical protein